MRLVYGLGELKLSQTPSPPTMPFYRSRWRALTRDSPSEPGDHHLMHKGLHPRIATIDHRVALETHLALEAFHAPPGVPISIGFRGRIDTITPHLKECSGPEVK
jgi:hypothetical protein